MSDLDRWAREHRHRAKREQIAKIRASRGGLWSGAIASGQIGMHHLASGFVTQQPSSGLFAGGSIGFGSGAIAHPMLVSGCISRGSLMATPIDWSKIHGAIGAG